MSEERTYYQNIPETVTENGITRMTGRMLTFDQSGNLVSPVTVTEVAAPVVPAAVTLDEASDEEPIDA